MASFQERILETIQTDFEQIKKMPADKNQRNECNILLKRIESAKKLCLADASLTAKLVDIEKKINSFKEGR